MVTDPSWPLLNKKKSVFLPENTGSEFALRTEADVLEIPKTR